MQLAKVLHRASFITACTVILIATCRATLCQTQTSESKETINVYTAMNVEELNSVLCFKENEEDEIEEIIPEEKDESSDLDDIKLLMMELYYHHKYGKVVFLIK